MLVNGTPGFSLQCFLGANFCGRIKTNKLLLPFIKGGWGGI